MEKHNTVGLRFAALIIDGIIVAIVTAFFSMVTSPFAENPKMAFVLNSAVSVAAVFYYIILHARYGQTVGKSAMRLKVLDVSEKPITLAQAVIRSLPHLFPAFVGASVINMTTAKVVDYDALQIFTMSISGMMWIWHIVDIIVCLSSDKKRALHDLIAGTVVVRTDLSAKS